MKAIFSDEEWRDLKRLSGLTDDYRPQIEEIVHFLREKPDLRNPRQARSQTAKANIINATKALKAAMPALRDLLKTGAGAVYQPLEVGIDNDACAVRSKNKIIALSDLMKDVVKDLEFSKEKLIPHVRSGRNRSHLTLAIQGLSSVLQKATGQSLNQKKRSASGIDLVGFALGVCRKAEPALSIKTIENSIKKLQSTQSESLRRRKK